jgi:dTDP-4-dehydrorhamnose 3,5-epimerase
MHFQLPPKDHVKVVYCTAGRVLDVIVDLRRGSPTFGQHVTIDLSAERANMVYIARGVAHGFYVPDETSTLVYRIESVHSPDHDAGIAWDGCGVSWPTSDPVLSARDRAFPALADFDTPFTFDGSAGP